MSVLYKFFLLGVLFFTLSGASCGNEGVPKTFTFSCAETDVDDSTGSLCIEFFKDGTGASPASSEFYSIEKEFCANISGKMEQNKCELQGPYQYCQTEGDLGNYDIKSAIDTFYFVGTVAAESITELCKGEPLQSGP